MSLTTWLEENRQEIVREWIRRTMAVYPPDAQAVLQRNRDRFANPLLHLISKGIDHMFDELTKGLDAESAAVVMDELVRLKAVQDFKPSVALSFIFELKEILEEALGSELEKPEIAKAFTSLQRDIDKMAALAFDIYLSCREKLYEIRANEIKNQTHMLIRRVNEMDKQKEAR